MSHRRRRQLKIVGYVVAGTLAVGAVGAVVSEALAPKDPPPVSQKVADYLANPPTKPAAPTPADLSPTVALLKNPSRPWTVGVLGDSTGNGDDEWVYLLAESMSAKYNRPVTIHNWSIDSNSYADATTVGDGAGRPITIWNGSAAGMNMEYSYKYRSAMLPARPDLLIVNHGHNLGGVQEARVGSYRLVDWAISAWKTPPAIAMTLQNPRVDKLAKAQASVVESLRQQWSGSQVVLIDAWTAYENANRDAATLLRPDGFHPNPAGEIVWAEAAKKALGL